MLLSPNNDHLTSFRRRRRCCSVNSEYSMPRIYLYHYVVHFLITKFQGKSFKSSDSQMRVADEKRQGRMATEDEKDKSRVFMHI